MNRKCAKLQSRFYICPSPRNPIVPLEALQDQWRTVVGYDEVIRLVSWTLACPESVAPASNTAPVLISVYASFMTTHIDAPHTGELVHLFLLLRMSFGYFPVSISPCENFHSTPSGLGPRHKSGSNAIVDHRHYFLHLKPPQHENLC